MPNSPAANPIRPEISVVFPLVDARGDGLEQVRSWTPQTMARDRYQVVAVSDGSNARSEDQVARLLASHDRLIRHPTRNFIELYDAGIRQSEGRLVVLTEHHCVANADCLAEVELFFRQHEFDGACLKIDWVCLNEIARLKWSQRNQERCAVLHRPGSLEQVSLRGLRDPAQQALERWRARVSVRPLPGSRRRGKTPCSRLPAWSCRTAVIRHLDDNSFGKVLDFIRNFTEGEILFLANNDPEYCERYFGFVEEWGQRFSGGPERARSVLRLLCRALWCELLFPALPIVEPNRSHGNWRSRLRAPSCRAAFASSEPIWVSSPLGPASPSGGSTSRDAFAHSRTRATEWFTTYVRKASSGGMLRPGPSGEARPRIRYRPF